MLRLACSGELAYRGRTGPFASSTAWAARPNSRTASAILSAFSALMGMRSPRKSSIWSFTAAYGSFMWAYIVCQDRNWWTLMVWLTQMQTWAPQSMIFAALKSAVG